MNAITRGLLIGVFALGFTCVTPAIGSEAAQAIAARTPAVPPYIVEGVYRAKWGYKEEYLDLIKKYQVRVLDRLKQLGYVFDYAIYTPMQHTSEDNRWDYRVVITYKDYASSTHEAEVSKQLFPDQATLKRKKVGTLPYF